MVHGQVSYSLRKYSRMENWKDYKKEGEVSKKTKINQLNSSLGGGATDRFYGIPHKPRGLACVFVYL